MMQRYVIIWLENESWNRWIKNGIRNVISWSAASSQQLSLLDRYR
jgi:hypothetical protein